MFDDIVGCLIEHDRGTAYGIAKYLKIPANTIRYNLKKLHELGIVIKEDKYYVINPIYKDDTFIKETIEDLTRFFERFKNKKLSSEGIFYFIQHMINHSELKNVNGRD